MGRLSKLRVVDPVLTNLATGYTNEQFVGDQLMPFVLVDKEGGKILLFGKEHFKVYSTERALRAKSNRINPEDIDGRDIVLDEHDLEWPIDYREDAEAAFPMQAFATDRVTEGLRLRHEKMVADLVQNPANYPLGNKIALSGSSKFSDPDSDPEGVNDDAKAAVRAKIVKEPNTLAIGYQTWRALKRHPKLKAILSDICLCSSCCSLRIALIPLSTICRTQGDYCCCLGVLDDCSFFRECCHLGEVFARLRIQSNQAGPGWRGAGSSLA